jgi:hypothetical protein
LGGLVCEIVKDRDITFPIVKFLPCSGRVGALTENKYVVASFRFEIVAVRTLPTFTEVLGPPDDMR